MMTVFVGPSSVRSTKGTTMDNSGFHPRDSPKQVGAGFQKFEGVVRLDRTESTSDLQW